MGDTSWDGHCITEKLLVASNKTDKEILKCFKDSKKKFNDKVIENIFMNSDVSVLSYSSIKKFSDFKLKISNYFNLQYTVGVYSNAVAKTPRHYVKFYLDFCKISDSSLKYEIQNIKEIDIGGYNLFDDCM